MGLIPKYNQRDLDNRNRSYEALHRAYKELSDRHDEVQMCYVNYKAAAHATFDSLGENNILLKQRIKELEGELNEYRKDV